MSFWKTAGIAAQGTSHIKKNMPCQDAVAAYVKNGVSVIALADGAGSASHSDQGANLVATQICKYLVSNFNKIYKTEEVSDITTEIVEYLNKKLVTLSKKLNCELKDLSSTLQFVVIKEDKQCIIGHIGDGCIVGSDDQEEWRIISSEAKTSAANETEFVTSATSKNTMRMFKGEIDETSTAFVLMSDGSERGLIDYNDPTNPTVANGIGVMCKWMRSISYSDFMSALESTLVNQLTTVTSDDCSLGFITKMEIEGLFEKLSNEEQLEILDKHYSHMYNAEAALKDCLEIINVLKTTDATVTYISKNSKVKASACTKILNILHKAGYLYLDDEIYSLVTEGIND